MKIHIARRDSLWREERDVGSSRAQQYSFGHRVVDGYVGLKIGFSEQYSWKGKGKRTLKDV